MKLEVHNSCTDFDSYRAARVKSLFNAESGANFDLTVDLPIDDVEWKLGVIVGPSGSGKTSLGRLILGEDAFLDPAAGWPEDRPIIDGIAQDGDFNAVTGALSSVGLGSVPTWLRPFHVLSNGEKFRACLARVIAEAPERVVIDEFSSVVDRQIARMGALAFGKAWKRTVGQCVLLSCHYDILDWLEPDWVYDTATAKFHGRWLHRHGWYQRPTFELDVWETDWRYWPLFEPHHYLKLPKMVAAKCYVGAVNDEPVCHIGVSTTHTGLGVEARACRLVVMPEWQGAGVGLKFLNYVCELQLRGEGRLPGRSLTTLFHTSHPGLCQVLRRDKRWRQVAARLYGERKSRSAASMRRAQAKHGSQNTGTGYGGHFRAVQGFRYYGEAGRQAAEGKAK